jgi:hypothetical protein
VLTTLRRDLRGRWCVRFGAPAASRHRSAR